MKKLIIAAALALAPSAVLAQDLSGTWKVDGAFDAMGVKYSVLCTLAEDKDGKLAGDCKDAQGAADPKTTGQVTGTNVEFAYDTTYQGTPVHLDYKGDVESDGTLKGKVETGGPEGAFTAAKQQGSGTLSGGQHAGPI